MIRKFVSEFAVFFLAAAVWSSSTAYAQTNDSYEPLFINDFYISTENTAQQENEQPNESSDGAAPVVLPSSVPYQVRSGDTFYRIARSFGLSVAEVIAANPEQNPNQLTIGAQLDIPIQTPALQLANGETPVIKQVISSTLTAYTAGYESTGKNPNHPQYGITYSGIHAEEGRTIAVDPALIPIGTKVYIDGIGIRTAEDTGSAIRGPRIDVFMTNEKAARQFGVKPNVKVYVLDEKTV